MHDGIPDGKACMFCLLEIRKKATTVALYTCFGLESCGLRIKGSLPHIHTGDDGAAASLIYEWDSACQSKA